MNFNGCAKEANNLRRDARTLWTVIPSVGGRSKHSMDIWSRFPQAIRTDFLCTVSLQVFTSFSQQHQNIELRCILNFIESNEWEEEEKRGFQRLQNLGTQKVNLSAAAGAGVATPDSSLWTHGEETKQHHTGRQVPGS
ncbi:hypothetical protein RRG08_005553 [Elysia crispata]|uniref:Uncharacterized protein n=1 Tax=Elysia crispata TaxID=231223 RepID=A0AAE1E0T8_9GAST|nr:hypothetical protein RRG08_005553 [Elysia crispata]